MNKQELIDKIRQEATLWDNFLAEVGEERMEEPGATGEWTFKDVVAHLSGWRAQTIARIEAAQRGQELRHYWPENWDEDNDQDLEKINRWIYEQNRDRSLADVLNESRMQFLQLEASLQALSDDDLFNPQRFAWMNGHALSKVAEFAHFHEEHEPVLRRWLK